ncbi:ion channel [Halobacillus salinarum]|uniref:Ion channel n=1 Tax=Halobacillus salinarum TaxID=2932257 RepID=A0ABY4EHQ0_9BACI|nr:potassium channel family protein [Halobacillus salinarum]UOQ43651.1 ion channel [Halobacillus salinarum]
MIPYLLLIFSLLVITFSLRQIFISLEMEQKIFSFHLFLSVILLYTIITVGFGIVYSMLATAGLEIFHDPAETKPLLWWEELSRSMYFSGVTLFTVGYGDLLPLGFGRWIALFEAMIGYALPAALVMKVWSANKQNS